MNARAEAAASTQPDPLVHPSPDPRSARWLRRFFLLGAGCLVAWTLASTILVPWLLELAHAGHRVPLLSDRMAGRETTPLEAYLESWSRVRFGLGLALGLTLVAAAPLWLTLPGASGRIERRVGGQRLSSIQAGALLAASVLAIAALVAVLAWAAPVAYVFSISEDHWIEQATFVSFVMAAGCFLWAGLIHREHRTLGLFVFGLVALLIGLDEISWGQRLLGLETPGSLEEVNLQREITLHNVWFPAYPIIALVVVVYAVGVPWLAERVAWLRRLISRIGAPLPPAELQPVFVVAAALIGISPMVGPVLKGDEISELALGLALALLGFWVAVRVGGGRRPTPAAFLLSAGGFGGALAVVATSLVVFASSPGSVTDRLHEYARERYPEAGGYERAERLYEYLYAHPERWTSATLVDYGAFLLERGEADRGRRILREAVAEHRARTARFGPPGPNARRQLVRAYKLLGRETAAVVAYRSAVRADEQRLAEAEDPVSEARVYFSLALTSYVYGDREAAFRHAAAACARTTERALQFSIQQWADSVLTQPSVGRREHTPNPCERS